VQAEKEEAYLKEHSRKKGSKKPAWNHNEENGAFVRKKGRGGIDWYRYQEVILKKILLPFANKLQRKKPGAKVQVVEDGAPAHKSCYQDKVYELFHVIRMTWPGNSPDLNAIEPCWFYMKRETSKRGVKGKGDMKERWVFCWKEMPQEMIQAWIERIPEYIKRVIELEGGNEYPEGRLKGQLKKKVY